VALLVGVAVHLAVSHICYNIIQGFVSGCIAALVRRVLGIHIPSKRCLNIGLNAFKTSVKGERGSYVFCRIRARVER
jgi:hypothetical protein